MCAVGWEPNPTHTDHLKGLETAYNNCGWKVIINMATGVGAHNQIGKVRIWAIIMMASLLKGGPKKMSPMFKVNFLTL